VTPAPRIAVLSRSWGRPRDEASFAVREVAAALSRLGPLEVVVPGAAAPSADGGFDVVGVGPPSGGGAWPAPHDGPGGTNQHRAAVVVEGDDVEGAAFAARCYPGSPVVAVGHGPGMGSLAPAAVLDVGLGPPARESQGVGLFVAVHPSVSAWRYLREGDDYVLVLSDRGPGEPDGTMSPLASAVVRRFPHRRVVVVDNGVASYWRLRMRLVDAHLRTRTDLWRLVSHASVTVDLAPGPLIARECVESLRYGVPIVVPVGTAGAELADAGGGLTYEDDRQLATRLRAMADHRLRARFARDGRELAERWYGDADGFVQRVSAVIESVLGPIGPGDGR
jgi:hypothetical protein